MAIRNIEEVREAGFTFFTFSPVTALLLLTVQENLEANNIPYILIGLRGPMLLIKIRKYNWLVRYNLLEFMTLFVC